MKIIEFYVRQIYGLERGYIKDPKDAKLVLELTGKKTIDHRTREVIRDLSGDMIQFQQVMFT